MPFLGHWYILVIVLVIVLIVYGPGKLPEVGGAIGRAMREFRKASSDMQDEIKRGVQPEATPESRPATERPANDVRSSTDSKAS